MSDPTNGQKPDILFIKAGGINDFIVKAIRDSGYDIEAPYRGGGVVLNTLRKFWFKLRLPLRHMWYNPHTNKARHDIIIVFDAQITPDYMRWLKAVNPSSQLTFVYNNLVGKTSHPLPRELPDDLCSKWSYDKGDCEKYALRYNPICMYFRHWRVEKREPRYDVFYIGRDKGRAEKLLAFEQLLNQQGLRTYFHIVATTAYQQYKKSFYRSRLSYDQIREKIADSRAILNMMPDEKQTGIIIRDMEAIFNEKKLITDNMAIKQADFYRRENVFILGKDDIDHIVEFLDTPYVPLETDILEKYSFEAWFSVMLNCGDKRA